MSHLRNLFHSPSSRPAAPPAPPAAPVAVAAMPEHEPAFATGTSVATAPPEFLVEVAHLSPEARLMYYDDPRSPAADRFRLLRMRLKEHWTAGRLKKLLITGPLASDGKSTVTLNLATALAERGKRKVLVIEADLHHASIGRSLKLRPWAGLSEWLADGATQPLSGIRRIEPLDWYLLPAGEPRKNATELLQTPAFAQILQHLAPRFDWILVDSPPVVPLTDSLSLQQHVDASLLVVRAGKTPREAVEQAVAMLGKKNIVGIVLNGVEARDHLYYQYGSKRYHED